MDHRNSSRSASPKHVRTRVIQNAEEAQNYWLLPLACLQRGYPLEAAVLALPFAAELHAPSQNLIGAYFSTTGLSRDRAAAANWFTSASREHYPGAKETVEEMMAWRENEVPLRMWVRHMHATDCWKYHIKEWHTVVQEREIVEAARWYQDRAWANSAWSYLLYGILLFRGLGVKKDLVRAYEWFRKAAELGHSAAKAMLCCMCCCGHGVEKNVNAARTWLVDAAQSNHASSQKRLGDCYASGYLVPQDYEQAVKWYRLAAMQGDNQAPLELAGCYYEGHGAAADVVTAQAWLYIAFERQLEDFEHRADVEGRLTPEQLSRARTLASYWRLPPKRGGLDCYPEFDPFAIYRHLFCKWSFVMQPF